MPACIPLEHGAYARLSRPFLDFFEGGSEYETSILVGVELKFVGTRGGKGGY